MNKQLKLYQVKIKIPSWLSPNVTEVVRADNKENAKKKIKESFIYNRQPYTITKIVEI